MENLFLPWNLAGLEKLRLSALIAPIKSLGRFNQLDIQRLARGALRRLSFLHGRSAVAPRVRAIGKIHRRWTPRRSVC